MNTSKVDGPARHRALLFRPESKKGIGKAGTLAPAVANTGQYASDTPIQHRHRYIVYSTHF
jgi:hypothetical protein